MYHYVTLQAIKNYIGGEIGTTEDALLTDLADWASRLIEDYKGRRFDVRRETRVYDTPQAASDAFGAFDSRYPAYQADPPLRLDDDLLALITLENGDGDELASSEYVLEPANLTPKNRIRLRSGGVWLPSENGPEQAIRVTGWWGYHERYADAWRSGGSSDSGVDADDVTIAMEDVSGIEIGALLRMEDELLIVEDIDSVSNSLVCERGANGSVAAAHLVGTAVQIYRPMGIITQIAMRLVKWRYGQRHTDNFDRTYVAGTGMVSTPTSLPADVARLLGARKAR